MSIKQYLSDLIKNTNNRDQKAVLVIFQGIMDGKPIPSSLEWQQNKEEIEELKSRYDALDKNYDEQKAEFLGLALGHWSISIANEIKKAKSTPELKRSQSVAVITQPKKDPKSEEKAKAAIVDLIKNTNNSKEVEILQIIHTELEQTPTKDDPKSKQMRQNFPELATFTQSYQTLKENFNEADAQHLCANLRILCEEIATKYGAESKDDTDYEDAIHKTAEKALDHFKETKCHPQNESTVWNRDKELNDLHNTLTTLKKKLQSEEHRSLKSKIQQDELLVKKKIFPLFSWMKEIPNLSYSEWAQLVTTEVADQLNKHLLWHAALLQLNNYGEHNFQLWLQNESKIAKPIEKLATKMKEQLQHDNLKRLVCKSTPAISQPEPKKPSLHTRAKTVFSKLHITTANSTSPGSSPRSPVAHTTSPKTGSRTISPSTSPRTVGSPFARVRSLFSSTKTPSSPPSSPRSGKH